MIDKSIRQHYEEGKKVNVIQEGIDKFTGNVKKKLFPQDDTGLDEKQLIKNVAESFLQRKLTTAAASKLAGTGILSSLGPIGMIIAAMLANKGIKYAKGKIKPDIKTALQSFQEGMIGSPKEQKELKGLEKRRANLIQRKDEGKTYSDKNLGTVTRAIAEAKGIDINNPNEMKNIDKDISNLYSKTITSQVIPKTPEIISPHLLGGDEIITPPKISPISYEDDFAKTTIEDIINKKVSPISYEDDFATTTIEDIITPPAWNPGIAAQEAAEKQATFDRAVAENKAKAAAEAAAARVWTPPVRHHTGGGGGNGGGNQASADARGGSSYSSPFAKGGRVDKALTGRSRDI